MFQTMFASQSPITPHLQLATLIVALVAPPLIAVWASNRWRFSLRTMLVVTVVFCVGSLFISQDFRGGSQVGIILGPPDPLETHLWLIKDDPIDWAKAFLLPSVLCLMVSTIVTVATMAIQKWLNRREH